MKIAELDKKFAEAEKAQAKMYDDLAAAKASADELAVKAEAAADAGDVDGYFELYQDAERAKARVHVLERQIEKNPARPTQEDITGAWEDFAKGYSKDFAGMVKMIDKAREAYVKAFGDLVAKQREALVLRQRLARYLGIDPLILCGNFNPKAEELLPMPFMEMPRTDSQLSFRLGNYRAVDPGLAFYLVNSGYETQNQMLTDEMFRKIMDEFRGRASI